MCEFNFICNLQCDQESQYIFDALIQGLDDYQTQQSDVTLEALRGLISLIPHLSLNQFEKHYTTLTFRIKQFFENVSKPFTQINVYNFKIIIFFRKLMKCVVHQYDFMANYVLKPKSLISKQICHYTIIIWLHFLCTYAKMIQILLWLVLKNGFFSET